MQFNYNKLPDVSDSHEHLHKIGLHFVEMIGKEIVKRKLQHVIGVRLIHRHFDLQPDEFMFEVEREEDGIIKIVSAPNKDLIDKLPGSWSIDESREIHVIDYVNMPLLSCKQTIDMDEVYEVLKFILSIGMHDILGACRIDKDFFSSRTGTLVELNYAESRTSKIY